jgi:hypothetical protein
MSAAKLDFQCFPLYIYSHSFDFQAVMTQNES